LILAWPAPFNTAAPRSVFPSLKSTLPLGIPPEEVTVAVNVTIWPAFDGLALLATVVVVEAAAAVFTICDVAAKLASKLALPA
jgi:hypothetical protein